MRPMEKRQGKTVIIAVIISFFVMLISAIVVAKRPVYLNTGKTAVTSVITTATTQVKTQKTAQITTRISSGKTQVLKRIKEIKQKVNPKTDGDSDTTAKRIDVIGKCIKKTSMINQCITDKIKNVITGKKETTVTELQSFTPEHFRKMGIIYENGYKYTWYSEKILPGKGLDIPGRHSDGNFVRDGDGYICVASSDLKKGTVVDTPFGKGKVYDTGCPSGVIDIYTSF